MVAASRLRRAQERIQHARPFAIEMLRVLNSLATRVDPSAHPLLDERKTPRAGGKSLLIVITADRGLCGSFNTNAIKAASTFIVENPAREVALGLVGRRGRDYFARRGFEVRYEQVNLFAGLQFSHAQGHRRRGGRSVHDRPGGQRLSGLQRIQVGHLAARRRRAAACRSAARDGADQAAAGRLRRARCAAAGSEAGTIDYLYEPTPQAAVQLAHPAARRGPGLARRCSSRTRRSMPRR